MDSIQALILGLLQGLTEYLPVSSSGHLTIGAAIFGIEGEENLDKVIDIDQSPIGRTPRSNPATYTGVFNDIRTVFSQTQDAKMRGYGPGRFSFNVRGGRCEACEGNGITTIHGFYGAKGARLKAVERKSRMIEIFGDSYTCGYGSDSPTQNEHFKIETENVDHAYGCLIARYFDTDYAIQAHSGQGMVRNYGDKKQRSDYSMLDRHTKVYDNDKTVEYDFKAYRPDIVLINLGTNDFSREVTPTPDQYVGNYVKMIKSLRSHYGNVPILCIMPHSARKYLQACFPILRERCYDDKQVYFAEPMLEVLRDGRDYGAAGPPNYQGHSKIAMKLIPQISRIMDWKMEDKIVK